MTTERAGPGDRNRVTDLADLADLAELAEGARRDAEHAARAARVRVVEAEDEQATRLVSSAGDLVWGPEGTFAPNELRALAFSGNPVHLALDEAEPGDAVVGFAVGFLGWSPALHVHSHQAGVVPGHRRRGIGYALKLAQRRTCLAHGITEMRWTFDPLVLRNAAFNVNALGVQAVAFHPDFYGSMRDAINAGDASDRLEALWDLTRPLPAPAARPAGATAGRPALLLDRDGRPVLTGHPPVEGAVVEVPPDYEAVRAVDGERSRAWRSATRQVLAGAYGAGLRIGAVGERGYQLVRSGGHRTA